MREQLDLLGGSTILGPPTVPAVVFRTTLTSRKVQVNDPCAHCTMNADRWRADPKSIPAWRRKADIVVLIAVYLITQPDGSTLYLCEQHAREHQQREARDV